MLYCDFGFRLLLFRMEAYLRGTRFPEVELEDCLPNMMNSLTLELRDALLTGPIACCACAKHLSSESLESRMTRGGTDPGTALQSEDHGRHVGDTLCRARRIWSRISCACRCAYSTYFAAFSHGKSRRDRSTQAAFWHTPAYRPHQTSTTSGIPTLTQVDGLTTHISTCPFVDIIRTIHEGVVPSFESSPIAMA